MRLLVVCTGNICRSPVMAVALRRALPGVEVLSAGTRAAAGRALHPMTGVALAPSGLDASGHRSRPLDRDALDGVDLVVTAEVAHRSAVVTLRPDLLRRTVTLTELVGLAEAVRPDDPEPGTEDAVRAALAQRGRQRVPVDDLPDPIGGGLPEHEQMVASVLHLVERLQAALTGGGLSHAAGPAPAG